MYRGSEFNYGGQNDKTLWWAHNYTQVSCSTQKEVL